MLLLARPVSWACFQLLFLAGPQTFSLLSLPGHFLARELELCDGRSFFRKGLSHKITCFAHNVQVDIPTSFMFLMMDVGMSTCKLSSLLFSFIISMTSI